MNKNVKIAKELLKIAKNLVAESNVADHEGEYKNFTGEIEWGKSYAEVKNATFELSSEKDSYITWENGTWVDGYWINGSWHGGTWEKGTWLSGDFYNGIFDMGVWQGGYFQGGTWNYGVWEGGYWLNGYDEGGNKHGKGDSPDKWDE